MAVEDERLDAVRCLHYVFEEGTLEVLQPAHFVLDPDDVQDAEAAGMTGGSDGAALGEGGDFDSDVVAVVRSLGADAAIDPHLRLAVTVSLPKG